MKLLLSMACFVLSASALASASERVTIQVGTHCYVTQLEGGMCLPGPIPGGYEVSFDLLKGDDGNFRGTWNETCSLNGIEFPIHIEAFRYPEMTTPFLYVTIKDAAGVPKAMGTIFTPFDTDEFNVEGFVTEHRPCPWVVGVYVHSFSHTAE